MARSDPLGITTIRYADLPDRPWKNGGGLMREIARAGPVGAPSWQLSRAIIARDGPFSRFDGMVRVLTVVEGAGVTLLVGAARLDARPFAPVRFDGSARTEARLRDGPVSPFNLVFDPRSQDGRVEILHGPLTMTLPALSGRELAIHSVAGDVSVGPHRLDPDDTAICGSPEAPLVLGAASLALLVVLDRIG